MSNELARARSYAFIFVSHGALEPESLLLATSLKRHLDCDYQLIAAVPTHTDLWGTPSAAGLRIFEQLGVRIASFTNDIDPAYPTANRIFCFNIPTGADKVFVLDTDIICLREFADEPRFAIPFNSKPASLRTFSTDLAAWRAAYAVMGETLPEMRLPATVTGEYTVPYFNTGLVAVDSNAGLGDVWLECCRQIKGNESIPGVGRWADQIALSVALEKLSLPYDSLDERYNFPLRLRPLGNGRPPIFCHYGNLEVAASEPAVVAAVDDLLADWPDITGVLERKEAAGPLLDAVERRRARGPAASGPRTTNTRPELVLTGIAGSGLEPLVELLNGYSNCVVLSEPGMVIVPRANQPAPWRIAPFYREARAAIAAGREPRGAATEEATLGRARDEPQPDRAVENDAFVLGTAHAHSYLLHLNAIRRAMPDARIVACVRDPYATIAGWKRHPDRLTGGDALPPSGDAPQRSTFPWLTLSRWDSLENVVAARDPVQRRAMWWQLLAELILDQGQSVTVVDYARLLSEPESVLDEVLAGYDAGARLSSPEIEPREVDTDVLDAADLQAIRGICSQSAADLGLSD